MARWMDKAFNVWLPRKQGDGSWWVVMHQLLRPPVRAADYFDLVSDHKMSEDEAMEFARRLNSIGFLPTTPPIVVMEISDAS